MLARKHGRRVLAKVAERLCNVNRVGRRYQLPLQKPRAIYNRTTDYRTNNNT